jgi:hypothetical protein
MTISSTPVQDVNALTGASSGTITFTSAPVSGNTLVAVFGTSVTTSSVTSITQTGVIWTLQNSFSTNRRVEVWTGVVSAGASTTATVANSGAFRVEVSEWSGLPSSTADVQGTNSGSSVNPATGSIAPTAGFNTLIIALFFGSGTALSSGPTHGFTALSTGSASNFQAAYLVQSSAASTSTDWTFTGSSTWAVIFATFKGPVQASFVPFNPWPQRGPILAQ